MGEESQADTDPVSLDAGPGITGPVGDGRAAHPHSHAHPRPSDRPLPPAHADRLGPRHPRPDPSPDAGADPAGEAYARRFRTRFQQLVRHSAAEPEAAEPAPDGAEPDPPETVAPAKPGGWRSAVHFLVVMVLVVGAAVALRAFVVGHYYIPSASMEPTLHGCPGCDDDHVAVDKVSYRGHAVSPGDIVVFDRPPGDTAAESELIKRVVAVGGDTVALRSGDVYVDGLMLDEPYVNKRCGPHPTRPLNGVAQWRVPRGEVFVLGDNRCDSQDSRFFGPIRTSSIQGRAFAIIWPLNRIRLL